MYTHADTHVYTYMYRCTCIYTYLHIQIHVEARDWWRISFSIANHLNLS